MIFVLTSMSLPQSTSKEEKTGDLSSAPKTTEVLGVSTSAPKLDEQQAAAHDDPADDIPDVRNDSPRSLK